MAVFTRGELQQSVRDGFSILLPVADTVRLLRKKIKLYRIVMVPQEHRRPRLILDLLEQPGEGTPSVNDTTDRETAPESMQFGRSFPHILQEI